MNDISAFPLIECAGKCKKLLPIAIDISNLLGKGEGKKYFDRGEALAYDERYWEYICKDDISSRNLKTAQN